MKKFMFDVPVKANMRIEIYAEDIEEAIEALYDYEKENEMEDENLIDFEYDVDNRELWDIREELE